MAVDDDWQRAPALPDPESEPSLPLPLLSQPSQEPPGHPSNLIIVQAVKNPPAFHVLKSEETCNPNVTNDISRYPILKGHIESYSTEV